MKRTYFVPMCVVSGYFLAAAIAGGIIMGMYGGTFDKLTEDFKAEFKDEGSYSLLYHEGLNLREQLSRNEQEFMELGVLFMATMGLVVVGWALDRRRLVRKVNELEEAAEQRVESPRV